MTADRGDAGVRLDRVLRRHLGDVAIATRTRIQRWIESGQVTVNGAPILRVATRAAFGDVVAVALPDEASPRAMAAEAVPLDVLFEDESLLVIDKPAGMVVHPTYRHRSGTAMNALLWHAQRWSPVHRPSIVGRLDKLTSGVMIVAKTSAVHAALQRTLASGRSDKEYLAIVYGRVNVARGAIDLLLARDHFDRRKIVASTTTGAPSLTRFERLARVAAPDQGLSLLCCRLATGRTHQIRVHLAARGWPIVGDPTYGEPRWSRIVDPALASALRTFPRQALHASRVAFIHPITRRRLIVVAPTPPDFQRLLDVTGLRIRR